MFDSRQFKIVRQLEELVFVKKKVLSETDIGVFIDLT